MRGHPFSLLSMPPLPAAGVVFRNGMGLRQVKYFYFVQITRSKTSPLFAGFLISKHADSNCSIPAQWFDGQDAIRVFF
jgi:hypothetical protein